jgi:KEOPS complex subunit Pcc1
MQENNSEWIINCNLSMKFNTEEDASIFYNSYMPEHEKIPKKRSKISVHQSMDEIIFEIKAKDVVAFRASINSILQFGNVVFKIIEKVDSLK